MNLPDMVGEAGGTGAAVIVAGYLLKALLKAWGEDRKEGKQILERVESKLDKLLDTLGVN